MNPPPPLGGAQAGTRGRVMGTAAGSWQHSSPLLPARLAVRAGCWQLREHGVG